MDITGEWTAFETKPRMMALHWQDRSEGYESRSETIHPINIEYEGDWRDSLFVRKEEFVRAEREGNYIKDIQKLRSFFDPPTNCTPTEIALWKLINILCDREGV